MTLKEHIAKRGWNKTEFARQAGVQPCTAARWVNGTQGMDVDKARELNAKFSIPLAVLRPDLWGKK